MNIHVRKLLGSESSNLTTTYILYSAGWKGGEGNKECSKNAIHARQRLKTEARSVGKSTHF